MGLINFLKGDKGEELVLKKLKSKLDNISGNYYLLRHAALRDISTSKDIDILLVHVLLGIFIIEVKNWNSLENLNNYNPFLQANKYQDILLTQINEKVGNVINVEYKVVFPNISKYEGEEFLKTNGYEGYINHAVFKEDLDNLEEFFKSTNPKIPKKEEFLKIVSMFIPKKDQKEIVPILTKDEVLFFDKKQLSVLNGYTGGLKVIRGVAGTGKTIILTNFIKNSPDKKFLVLCFNKKLAKKLKEDLYSINVKVFSLFAFLEEIGFKFDNLVNESIRSCPKCGKDLVLRNGKNGLFIGCNNFPECKFTKKLDINEKFYLLETQKALDIFRILFRKYQLKEKFDYFMCDETQDFPAGIVRIIIEEIKNSILFIDEAQKIYPYTMNSIRDVLWHEKLGSFPVTKNNFKNLYNVYRTPSNISKCAFEVLSFDEKIDSYYRQVRFIQNNFLNDINFILEEGEFLVDNFNDLEDLKSLVDKIEGQKLILSFKNDDVEEIEKKLKVQAMPMAAVKGLEAENVIIHNFEEFLNVASKNDIFYRQIYVLLTRSKKNIFISINEKELIKNEKIEKVLKVLKKYSNSTLEQIADVKIEKEKKIDKETITTTKDILVAGLEIFAAIAGVFNM